MSNYQLYRTNIKLGGQMKWDIIVDSGGSNDNNLFVSDLHLTPVSDNVVYNRYSHDDLLNYSHLGNIKDFYSEISGSFYENCGNPIIEGLSPYITNDDYGKQKSKCMDNHDDILEAGLKRINYSIYNKQFSFFCPLWLESYDPSKSLEFTFYIYTRSEEYGDQLIAQRTLKFTQLDATDDVYSAHNKFIDYFNEFESLIESDNNDINREVIKINLKDKTSYIRGIDVSSGTYVGEQDISLLTTNLVACERLLMDTDSLIIDNFEVNKLVACQLLNLNFVFNAEDLIPARFNKDLYGAPIGCSMSVKYDGVEFEMRDFYSNYDYIPCKLATSSYYEPDTTDVNVFDVIKDPQNINLKDKNKTTQNIIHWSLASNNDYIFNLYSGFGGYIPDNISGGVKPSRTKYTYQDSTDIYTISTSMYSTGLNWLNVQNTNYNSPTIDVTINNDDRTNSVVLGGQWLSGIKFNAQDNQYYCDTFVLNDSTYSTFINSKSKDDNYLVIGYPGDTSWFTLYAAEGNPHVCIIIPSSKLKTLVYRNFRNKLHLLVNTEDNTIDEINQDGKYKHPNHRTFLQTLHTWLWQNISQWVVRFPRLGYKRADGPTAITTEVEHYITRDKPCMLPRYDGSICPCFVDVTMNNYYIKKFTTQSNYPKSDHATYADTGYKELYESIGYYPWESFNITINKDGLPVRDANDGVENNYEHRFFGNNQMYILKQSFTSTVSGITVSGSGNTRVYIVGGTTYAGMKELIKEQILSVTYNSADDDFLDFIYDKYSIKTDWEYTFNDDINTYDYKVTFVLK